MNFDQAFELLVSPKIEGEYSNHKNDKGGATRWGVTEAAARRHGYTGDMRELPLDFAKRIYREDYWDRVRAEDMPAHLRYPMFDAAVNSGPPQAVMWLQQALGVEADGVIGPRTLSAARQAGPALEKRIIAKRLRYMASLGNWPSFGRGWANRIATVLEL